MYLIRVLETRLQALCDQGLGADLHFSTGQECISVGVMQALRPSDYIVTHHRTIAHAVAKGVPLEGLVCELLGRANGINGGLAGEMHMSYPEKRFMFSFQLVGTCVPVAAGLAWAVKNYLKTDDIVTVFHGDAATANGQWHEGVNLAAVMKLPLLLVCEDNRLAGNVTPDKYLPTILYEKARAYGIPAFQADGNKIDQVTYFADALVKQVREQSRPALLICDTTRLGKHKQGQGDIRTREEMDLLRLRDPLLKILLDEDTKHRLTNEVEAAIQFALASPFPKESE